MVCVVGETEKIVCNRFRKLDGSGNVCIMSDVACGFGSGASGIDGADGATDAQPASNVAMAAAAINV